MTPVVTWAVWPLPLEQRNATALSAHSMRSVVAIGGTAWRAWGNQRVSPAVLHGLPAPPLFFSRSCVLWAHSSFCFCCTPLLQKTPCFSRCRFCEVKHLKEHYHAVHFESTGNIETLISAQAEKAVYQSSHCVLTTYMCQEMIN